MNHQPKSKHGLALCPCTYEVDEQFGLYAIENPQKTWPGALPESEAYLTVDPVPVNWRPYLASVWDAAACPAVTGYVGVGGN